MLGSGLTSSASSRERSGSYRRSLPLDNLQTDVAKEHDRDSEQLASNQKVIDKTEL